MRLGKAPNWLALALIAGSTVMGQGDDRLVGVWDSDEGFRTSKLLLRSDGRYQLDSQSTDPDIGWSSSERGRYLVEAEALTVTPYDYLIRPEPRRYQFERRGDSLSLTGAEYGETQLFQLRPGSQADVLTREHVDPGLVGIWRRHIAFLGEVACTFRPGGYYVVKQTPDNPQFATSYLRGRYEQAGKQLTLKPYSEAEEVHEMDFFGNELTLLKTDDFSSESVTFEAVPRSETEVPVKAADAEAFVTSANWQVGVWEIRDDSQIVDLTLRPDGRYTAERVTGLSKEVVRGRYTLDSKRIHLIPFIGQDLYAHTGGEFGNAERIRQMDYYDGELQFIDLEAIIQSVTVARKRLGSKTSVTDKVRQAQGEQAHEGWCVGIWQVNDAAGWMEFTFRPDQRYIAKAGEKGGVPKEVERGRYRLGANKLSLAPYPNLGEPKGFELDLYDGALLLIGDPYRIVVAQKVPESEVGVTAATTDPEALKGTGGPLVGLWTLDLNGYHAELLFRPDGQFRLVRCVEGKLLDEYGLHSVNLPSRTLVLDSRLEELVTAGLDFYANTMTLVSTNRGFPATYVIKAGMTDAALQASFAADVEEAQLDALWLRRVPIGPRNPDIGPGLPPLPFDFQPRHVFEEATVFTEYRHYQQLIRSYVGITPVVNSRDWHFLRNGRVLIRFIHHRSEYPFPVIIAEKIDTWGAYGIEPNRATQDILHLYADNVLRIETDVGEQLELTLEDGRRHLFWGKDRAVLDESAAEEQPIPCQLPDKFDPIQMNTGVSLRTTIAPDDLIETFRFSLARSVAGNLTVQGTSAVSATLVTEHATSLTSPVRWEALQTNAVPGGPFNFTIPAPTSVQAYYRLRQQ